MKFQTSGATGVVPPPDYTGVKLLLSTWDSCLPSIMPPPTVGRERLSLRDLPAVPGYSGVHQERREGLGDSPIPALQLDA